MRVRAVALTLLGPLAVAAAVAGPASAGPSTGTSASLTASGALSAQSSMAGMTEAEMASMHGTASAREGAVLEVYSRALDGKLPKIKGVVGPDKSIRINMSSVPAGEYKFVVDDRSAKHNFHLTGGAVNEATAIDFVGKVSWKLSLTEGRYRAVCDAHSSYMRTDLQVTA